MVTLLLLLSLLQQNQNRRWRQTYCCVLHCNKRKKKQEGDDNQVLIAFFAVTKSQKERFKGRNLPSNSRFGSCLKRFEVLTIGALTIGALTMEFVGPLQALSWLCSRSNCSRTLL
jgi:hypothetical protein